MEGLGLLLMVLGTLSTFPYPTLVMSFTSCLGSFHSSRERSEREGMGCDENERRSRNSLSSSLRHDRRSHHIISLVAA